MMVPTTGGPRLPRRQGVEASVPRHHPRGSRDYSWSWTLGMRAADAGLASAAGRQLPPMGNRSGGLDSTRLQARWTTAPASPSGRRVFQGLPGARPRRAQPGVPNHPEFSLASDLLWAQQANGHEVRDVAELRCARALVDDRRGRTLGRNRGSGVGADKITFLTSWFAQPTWRLYQAKATGLYEKAGLDVTIRMGGPQVSGMQLLLAGETDFMMGYDLQVLKMLEQGLPVITVGTSFQFDLQGMMTHDDVASLADLKDKTILVATSGRTTWWPWLKAKYKYTDEQTKPYTFNLQPFFADKNVVQQSYPSSEPFQAKQQGVPVKFFLFARDGYLWHHHDTTRSFVDKTGRDGAS
jgi:hypothetical protein